MKERNLLFFGALVIVLALGMTGCEMPLDELDHTSWRSTNGWTLTFDYGCFSMKIPPGGIDYGYYITDSTVIFHNYDEDPIVLFTGTLAGNTLTIDLSESTFNFAEYFGTLGITYGANNIVFTKQ